MTCVAGVSGSGKSTLINETLYLAAARQINRASEDHRRTTRFTAWNISTK